MCQKLTTTHIYNKCGHRVTGAEFTVVRCAEATQSGVNCTGDKLKDSPMGSTKKPGLCPKCQDEGYSDSRRLDNQAPRK